MRTYVWIDDYKYFWSDRPKDVTDWLYKYLQKCYEEEKECDDIRITCVKLDPLDIDPDLQR